MTKYFTIGLAGLTADQEKLVAAKWKDCGWWHGVSNFWLLRDHTGTMSAASVRDDIRAVTPSARVLVVECAPETWAGNFQDESNREWLRKYWPPEGQ